MVDPDVEMADAPVEEATNDEAQVRERKDTSAAARHAASSYRLESSIAVLVSISQWRTHSLVPYSRRIKRRLPKMDLDLK